jgi:bacterioferritin-associated ferredoxin
MYVCSCKAITTADVRQAGRAGVLSSEALVAHFGLDDSRCCGRCLRQVERFVELAWEGARPAGPALRPALQPQSGLAPL